MRLLLFITLLILSAPAAAQDIPTECPAVSIAGPTAPTQPGETMVFSANAEVENWKKLGYRWTVSIGTITSGQGTPSIVVQTKTEHNNTFSIATVEVEGLAAECPKTFSSERAEVAGPGHPPMIAEAESFSWAAIKAGLEKASKEFLSHPTHVFYVIAYTPRRGETKSTTSRRERLIKNFLLSRYKITDSRVVFVAGGPVANSALKVYRVPPAPLTSGV